MRCPSGLSSGSLRVPHLKIVLELNDDGYNRLDHRLALDLEQHLALGGLGGGRGAAFLGRARRLAALIVVGARGGAQLDLARRQQQERITDDMLRRVKGERT